MQNKWVILVWALVAIETRAKGQLLGTDVAQGRD